MLTSLGEQYRLDYHTELRTEVSVLQNQFAAAEQEGQQRMSQQFREFEAQTSLRARDEKAIYCREELALRASLHSQEQAVRSSAAQLCSGRHPGPNRIPIEHVLPKQAMALAQWHPNQSPREPPPSLHRSPARA